MQLVILSDTHGKHHDVKVPNGDVLIHCGDCTDDPGQASLRSFLKWMELLPHKHKILIAGNHDWAFAKWPSLAQAMVKEITNVHYLEESGIEIEGLKFWGSPYQPEFCDWAFNVPRGPELKAHWDKIPDDTDVLITHCPPRGYLDVSGLGNERCGCRDLYEAVLEVQPTLHCFGHIHHSYGTMNMTHDMGNKTIMVNASICDESYQPTRHPWIIDL